MDVDDDVVRVTLLRFSQPRNCVFGDMDELIASVREASGCWVDWHVAGAHGEFVAICCQRAQVKRAGLALLKVISDISLARHDQERVKKNDDAFSLDPEVFSMGHQEPRTV